MHACMDMNQSESNIYTVIVISYCSVHSIKFPYLYSFDNSIYVALSCMQTVSISGPLNILHTMPQSQSRTVALCKFAIIII